MEKSSAQMVVKVLSIIGIVFSALAAILSLFVIFGGQMLSGLFDMFGGGFSSIFGGALVFIGVIMLIIALFSIYLYIQTMKYVNWARIVVIVFSALGVLGALFGLPESIISLIINGVYLYFFAFNKDVVALYNK